jgi:hypothetical protein
MEVDNAATQTARTAGAQQGRIKGLQQALEYKRSLEAESVARSESAEAARARRAADEFKRAEFERALEKAERQASAVAAELRGISEAAAQLIGKAESQCIVCRAQPKTMASVPCSHKSMCNNCAARILRTTKLCPVCRQRATSMIRVFD